jgi:hypothetical protein
MEDAIKINIKYQKKYKKDMYTKPLYFHLIETFISKKELICYGGTAINVYLPNDKKFYEDIDIPDYDCFSSNPIADVKELADVLVKNNIENVEVKSAMFHGTYKIFVNFIPIVDISHLDKEVFINVHKKAIKINNLLYASPNYLRISLYQELSRPMGDVSRWDKIYKRLELLNKARPLYISNCSINSKDTPETDDYVNINKQIINIINENKWVVFGDYGMSFYLKYFPKKYQKIDRIIDIPYILAENIKDVIKKIPFKTEQNIFSYHFLNNFYQILHNGVPILYVFITNSCQSYNEIKGVRVASIDTIMSIYYALSFLNIKFFDIHKILSYCYLLHNVNTNVGVCRRFNMPCIGKQQTIEDIRTLRDKKYKIYKKNNSKRIYNEYFFQYKPKKTYKKSSKLIN